MAQARNTHENIIGARLRAEMKSRGISSADLAEKADVKLSFIYDVISGKSANPSTVKLARVAEALQVSLAYLAGSVEQAVLRPAGKDSAQDDYIAIPRLQIEVTTNGSRLATMQREDENCYFRKSWVKEKLSADPSQLRLLYVDGDGMAPTLCGNDMLLVDTGKKIPSPPGMFIIFDGFGLVPKRLEYVANKSGKRVRVISDNPQYSSYDRLIEDIVIVGRIVWFSREL